MPRRLTRKFPFPVDMNKLYIDIPRIARRCSLCGSTLPKSVPHYAYTKEYKSCRRKSRINVCPSCVDARQDDIQMQFRTLRGQMQRMEELNRLPSEDLQKLIRGYAPVLGKPRTSQVDDAMYYLIIRILRARGDPEEPECYTSIHITKKRWKGEKVDLSDPSHKCPRGRTLAQPNSWEYRADRRPDMRVLNTIALDQIQTPRLYDRIINFTPTRMQPAPYPEERVIPIGDVHVGVPNRDAINRIASYLNANPRMGVSMPMTIEVDTTPANFRANVEPVHRDMGYSVFSEAPVEARVVPEDEPPIPPEPSIDEDDNEDLGPNQ